jgi:hypothetical protein
MARSTSKAILTATASILVLTQNALCALSESDVEKLIRGEKTWTNRSGLTVKINANELTIGTYREQGATDKDMKIDSIMITRKIMEADPDVARVKLRFYDPVNRRNYQLVDVRQSDIKAYSQGLVTMDALLTGVDIDKVTDTPEVAEGPFGTERLQAKQQIDKLRNQGVGVATFVQIFGHAEDLAGQITKEPTGADAEKKKEELRSTLDRLMKAFDDHANFVRQHKEKTVAKQTALLNQSKAAATGAPRTAQRNVPPPAETDPGSGLEKLGMFTPIPGPFLLDRLYIGRALVHLKKQNVPIIHLAPIWQRMEVAVRNKDTVSVQHDMEYLQKHLNLQPLTEEERKGKSVIRTTAF